MLVTGILGIVRRDGTSRAIAYQMLAVTQAMYPIGDTNVSLPAEP